MRAPLSCKQAALSRSRPAALLGPVTLSTPAEAGKRVCPGLRRGLHLHAACCPSCEQTALCSAVITVVGGLCSWVPSKLNNLLAAERACAVCMTGLALCVEGGGGPCSCGFFMFLLLACFCPCANSHALACVHMCDKMCCVVCNACMPARTQA